MDQTNNLPKAAVWISYGLQGILVVMFLMGAFSNVFKTEMAVKGAMEMGYAEETVVPLGIILLIATALFAIPKTSFIGGLLLTGWLGGAVATHFINGDPVSFTIMPVLFGFLIWLSLWLRNRKLRALVF